MTRKRRNTLLVGGLGVLCLLVAGALLAFSSDADVDWDVVAGGGGRSASSRYSMQGATGQLAVGGTSSANYRIGAGYWRDMTADLSVSVSLPERTDIPVGGSYAVPVSAAGVVGKGSLSLQTALTYDGTVIRPLGVLTDGTMTKGWEVDFNILPGNSPDTLKIAMATAQDTLSGSGTLFYISVEAAEGASVGDSTLLHFESFRFNENTTEVGMPDGMIYITEPVRLLGDVTDNGAVTAFDAAQILRHTVGMLALTGEDSVCADVSGNGTLSALDASYVLQYVVGHIVQFPVEQPSAKVVYAPRTMRIGEMGPLDDGRVSLPILIDDMDGVVAGEVTMSVSEAIADVMVRTSELTSEYLLTHHVQDGCIRVSFAGAVSRAGPGSVLELVFDGSDVGLLSSLSLERVLLNEGRIPVQIVGREAEIPTAYGLSQNYPNPFNPATTIRYALPAEGRVTVCIYNTMGQRVRMLVEREQAAGYHRVVWDGRDGTGQAVASGLYLCRMVAGEYSAVRKLALVR